MVDRPIEGKSGGAASSPGGASSSSSDEGAGAESSKGAGAAPAEYYDEGLDDRDERWAAAQRPRGRRSDAVLSCPACFATLCLDCQRHDQYVHQYRAMFVTNCRTVESERLRVPAKKKTAKKNRRRGRRAGQEEETGQGSGASMGAEAAAATAAAAEGNDDDDLFHPVRCATCETEVAVLDKDEVYHFFNVLPSYS